MVCNYLTVSFGTNYWRIKPRFIRVMSYTRQFRCDCVLIFLIIRFMIYHYIARVRSSIIVIFNNNSFVINEVIKHFVCIYYSLYRYNTIYWWYVNVIFDGVVFFVRCTGTRTNFIFCTLIPYRASVYGCTKKSIHA